MAISTIPRSSGIYIISNIKSKKVYIGQSQNIRKRLYDHRFKLNAEYHCNPHLQASWNKYGEKAFKFEVLELCTVEQLDEREQHYLDIYIPKGICYNVATDVQATNRGRKETPEARAKKIATRMANGGYNVSEETREKLRIASSGHVHSEEQKEKMRIAATGRKHTPETCMKMSAMNKGKKHSPETRAKIIVQLKQAEAAKIAAHVKNYVVISPNGEEQKITNLSKFCRENGLKKQGMTFVAQGKHKHHKGWKCRYA